MLSCLFNFVRNLNKSEKLGQKVTYILHTTKYINAHIFSVNNISKVPHLQIVINTKWMNFIKKISLLFTTLTFSKQYIKHLTIEEMECLSKVSTAIMRTTFFLFLPVGVSIMKRYSLKVFWSCLEFCNRRKVKLKFFTSLVGIFVQETAATCESQKRAKAAITLPGSTMLLRGK